MDCRSLTRNLSVDADADDNESIVSLLRAGDTIITHSKMEVFIVSLGQLIANQELTKTQAS